MQKKISWIVLALVLVSSLQINAQYDKTDSSHKKLFIGSTLFLFGNLDKVNPPGFALLNIGYRITGKDVISLELKTWKHAWPLGINPFYNDAYKKPEEKFPGYIREYGFAIIYQRYLWKGLFLAVDATPMWQTYKNENGDKVGSGFIIFSTNKVGYHIKLFKDRVFLQPGIAIAGRIYQSNFPADFKEKDDKWPKWTPEPSLNFGFNF
ncbi:MAG: hypothetical protein QM534_13605 [Sediminibacterium sp.]|nr:hypothetical protein [Sediminibacterium sp.]